eukprot:TRINITY_DN25913_c0_g1_i1.p1 TRINITY_DN25913_c0_g1~~TRINITY_DN25913_c0_g1_i1.p1  ORF type:complete len:972 (-),score=146.22 TRINITY_DN25913_c0_g1_i1:105-2981(-)
MAINQWMTSGDTDETHPLSNTASDDIDAALRLHLNRQAEYLKIWLAEQEKNIEEQHNSMERMLADMIDEVTKAEVFAHRRNDTKAGEIISNDSVVELPGYVTWSDSVIRSELRPANTDHLRLQSGSNSRPVSALKTVVQPEADDILEVLVLQDDRPLSRPVSSDLARLGRNAPGSPSSPVRNPGQYTRSAGLASLAVVKSTLHCHASQTNQKLEQWALRREKAGKEVNARVQSSCKALRKVLRQKEDELNHVAVGSGETGGTPDVPQPNSSGWIPPKEDGSLARRCFLLFDQAENYFVGKLISAFMVTAIVLSTVSFVLESMPTFQTHPDLCAQLKAEGKPLTVKACEPVADITFYYIEVVCIVIFTYEYLIRVFTSFTEPEFGSCECVRVLVYAKMPLNIIDVAAVAPFYLGLCLDSEAISGIRVLRLARVLRLFKLAKHHPGIQLCIEALISSGLPLAILAFFNLIFGIIFAALIYMIEGQTFSVDSRFTNATVTAMGQVLPAPHPTGVFVRQNAHSDSTSITPFRSIPVSLWWVFTTTTTVGYGDLAPTTPLGQVVGVCCFYTGVIFLALPIGVLSSNFETAYASYMEKKLHAPQGTLQVVEETIARVSKFRRTSLFVRLSDTSFEKSVAQRIFRILSDPNTSIAAKAMSYMITLVILITTATMIMESMPEFNKTPAECTPDNLTIQSCKPKPLEEFFYIEYACIVVFTVDYVLRVATCSSMTAEDLGVVYKPHESVSPQRATFRYCMQWLNLVDLFAVVPFWLERAGLNLGSSAVLRVVRLVRVFRLLKSPKMRTCVDMVIDIVRDALPGIVSVFSLTCLVCILFSSCIYFAEGGEYSVDHFQDEYPYGVYIRPTKDGHGVEVSPFKSISSAFWWFFATATTVGFGDDYPTTLWGRLTAICAFYSGIVLVAIKLTIVGGCFQSRYPEWASQQLGIQPNPKKRSWLAPGGTGDGL